MYNELKIYGKEFNSKEDMAESLGIPQLHFFKMRKKATSEGDLEKKVELYLRNSKKVKECLDFLYEGKFDSISKLADYFGVTSNVVRSAIFKYGCSERDFEGHILKYKEKKEKEGQEIWRFAFGKSFSNMQDLADEVGVTKGTIRWAVKKAKDQEELENLILKAKSEGEDKEEKQRIFSSTPIFGVCYASYSEADEALGLPKDTICRAIRDRLNGECSSEKLEDYILNRRRTSVKGEKDDIWKNSFGKQWDTKEDLSEFKGIPKNSLNGIIYRSSSVEDFERRVENYLNNLKSKTKEVFMLYGKEYSSYRSIAYDLGIGATVVKRLVHKRKEEGFKKPLDFYIDDYLRKRIKNKRVFVLFGKEYKTKTEILKDFNLSWTVLYSFIEQSNGSDSKLEDLLGNPPENTQIEKIQGRTMDIVLSWFEEDGFEKTKDFCKYYKIPYKNFLSLLRSENVVNKSDVKKVLDYWQCSCFRNWKTRKCLFNYLKGITEIKHSYEYKGMNYYLVTFENDDLKYVSNRDLLSMCNLPDRLYDCRKVRYKN